MLLDLFDLAFPEFRLASPTLPAAQWHPGAAKLPLPPPVPVKDAGANDMAVQVERSPLGVEGWLILCHGVACEAGHRQTHGKSRYTPRDRHWLRTQPRMIRTPCMRLFFHERRPAMQ